MIFTYQKPPSHWCQHKHVLASRTIEVGWYGLPKNKIACKDQVEAVGSTAPDGADLSDGTDLSGGQVVARVSVSGRCSWEHRA